MALEKSLKIIFQQTLVPNQSVKRILLANPSVDSTKQSQLLEFIKVKTGSVANTMNPFKLLEVLSKLEEDN